MAPLKIVVDGEATIPRLAERAVLNIKVSASGKNKEWVSDQVTTTAKHLRTKLQEMSPESALSTSTEADAANAANSTAAIVHWTMNSLSTSSYVDNNVPVETPSSERDTIHSASTTFEIRFRNFAALGPFATNLASLSHVSIQSVTWILTTQTRQQYESELRRMAAKDALRRATDYAEALGLATVRPLLLSESAGYTRTAGGAGPTRTRQTARKAVVGAGLGQAHGPMGMATTESSFDTSDLAFQPEEVHMYSSVNCEFEAE